MTERLPAKVLGKSVGSAALPAEKTPLPLGAQLFLMVFEAKLGLEGVVAVLAPWWRVAVMTWIVA